MKLAPQLVIQVYALMLLMEAVVRVVPNYYAQRIPAELGRWDWIIDPKDARPTRFEEVWRKTLLPLLQSRSLENPMARVEGFDYSAFDRFRKSPPDYLKPFVPAKSARTKPINLGKLFNESVAFPDSRSEPGLQLVDIVASAFTKAMNGKLPEPVWSRLGALTVQKPDSAPTVGLVVLGDGAELVLEGYQRRVINTIRWHAKPMIAQ